jgi:anaerobic selenocysteine-containing dehydrogenase
MSQHVSYCRICQASCGVLVDVEDGRVVRVAGDRDNALSGGFTCPKGRRGGDFHYGPDRLTTSMRRGADGRLHPVEVGAAITEIAARLQTIIDAHGVDAVGIFQGTQSTFATLTRPFLQSWIRALGSRKHFSTMTIDQSAKWIVPLRMGQYLGGPQRFEDADVWLLSGTNPLVSVNAGNFDSPLVNDPSARIRDARARGLRLIVIDPRRTETAARADLHLQPLPGHDALIFAGLLNVILNEDLHDADFCARFVDGLDELRTAVAAVTPELVEQGTGVPAAQLIDAARIFGRAGRGMVSTGTGVCMGPNSNVAEHLAICLNVVCGRYLREGEAAGLPAMLQPMSAPRAEVSAPDRSWERGFRSRIGNTGQLFGQLPSGVLADEVLEPGPDRVRALIVVGGNPVSALPDTAKAARAFEALELLVTIDPRLTETSQLADFVIAPTLEFERADHTVSLEAIFPIPFAQYTPALVPAPAGVIEDWAFLSDWLRRWGWA